MTSIIENKNLMYKHNFIDEKQLKALEDDTLKIWTYMVPNEFKSEEHYLRSLLLDIEKFELKEQIGDEFLCKTNIEILLDQNAYIWFRKEAKWALKLTNILLSSDFSSLYENLNHMYYDGKPMDFQYFQCVLEAAKIYHEAAKYDEYIDLDEFIMKINKNNFD